MSDFTVFLRTTTPMEYVDRSDLFVWSITPDVDMTQLGGGQYAVPYSVYAKVINAEKYTETVNFGGSPILTKKSFIPYTEGGELGTGGGVKSCTVNGPTEKKKPLYWPCSRSVKAEGEYIIRKFDLFNMNNGNTIGEITNFPRSNFEQMTTDTGNALHEQFTIKWNSFLKSLTFPGFHYGGDGSRGFLRTIADCFTTHNGVTRLGGVFQFAGGVFLVFESIPAAETPFGWVGIAFGADEAGTGLVEIWTGEAKNSVRGSAVEKIAIEGGMSKESAKELGEAFDVSTGLIAGTSSINDVIKSMLEYQVQASIDKLASQTDGTRTNIDRPSPNNLFPEPFLDPIYFGAEYSNQEIENKSAKTWTNAAIGNCAIVMVATPEHNVHIPR